MNKKSICVSASNSLKRLKKASIKHSPELLISLGIVGGITTVVLSIDATVKAVKICESLKAEKIERDEEPPTKKEYIKAVWKNYIPPFATATLSTASIIFSDSINRKRQAALTAAYVLSENMFREHTKKVHEVMGDKTEKKVYDYIAKEKIENTPIVSNEVVLTRRGETLCMDTISGRYFKSNIDSIKKSINELNHRLIRENYISLNDYYDELGLPHISLGDMLGWNVVRPLIDPVFTSELTEDGTPCLVIQFSTPPVYKFYEI